MSEMVFQFSNKQALLDALEARRPWAVALDKKNKVAHEAKEKAVLRTFKERARAALKWSYADLKANNWGIDITWRDRPSCPQSAVEMLDRTIAFIQRDGRKRFKVTESGFRSAHYLLSFDENKKPDVCS